MNGIEIAALVIFGSWAAGGLVLFGMVVYHSGLPNETYDGWRVQWGETFGLLLACVIGAPFWAWIWWSERRAEKASKHPSNVLGGSNASED